MITISNTEVVGWEHAIRGMRNPKNSWEKSDSCSCNYPYKCVVDCDKKECESGDHFYVGPNDRKLMMTLRNAGTDHRKFMRMITVYLDITAPLYWWKEFDTYKVGTVANSCSTMHKIHAKEFVWEDFSDEHLDDERNVLENCNEYQLGDHYWPEYTSRDILNLTIYALNYYRDLYLKTKDKQYWWQMIQLLPSSYNQKRTVMLNYEVLANMYKSRRNHKLDEWHTLCDWMETLPYSELITGNATWREWSEQDLYKIATYIQTIDPRIKDSNSYIKVATNHNTCDFVVDDKVLYSFDTTKVTVKDAIDFIRDFVDKLLKEL